MTPKLRVKHLLKSGGAESVGVAPLEPRRYFATINIHDYGALGNGISDDRPAIQAALNAAQANDTVVFPTGTFRISGTLLVTKPGLKLAGGGRNSCIRASSPLFNLVYVTADNLVFSHLAFEGAANTDSTTQFGIFTDAGSTSSNGLINGCYFTGPSASADVGLNNGVKFETGSNGWKLNSTRFDHLIGTASGTGYGVLIGASSGHTISNNEFYGAYGEGRHAVYLAGGTSNTLVESNFIDHFNQSSVSLYSLSYQPAVTNNIIRGNLISDEALGANGTAGIELAGKVTNNTIDANVITRPGRHGIIVGDAAQGGFTTDNIISGNQISYAGEFGIVLDGAIRSVVSSNTVNDAGLEIPGGYSAIHIQSFYTSSPPVIAAGNIVRDNLLRGIGTGAARYRYGIWINPSVPTPQNTSLLNNKIGQGVLGSIEITSDSLATTTSSGNTLIQGSLQADANFDGKVTSVDFNLLAANFGNRGVFWSGGDADYDGDVDAIDFNILISTYGLRLPPKI